MGRETLEGDERDQNWQSRGRRLILLILRRNFGSYYKRLNCFADVDDLEC